MRIVIARHGRTNENQEGKLSGNSNNAQLIQEGLEHAKRLAEVFKNEKFEVIYSSPLDRAFKTAGPIADVLGILIHKDERLAEMDFGTLDGAEEKGEAKEILEKRNSDLNYKLPEGESYYDVLKRGESFVKYLLSKDFKDVLIIGHHRINTALLTKLLGVDSSKAENISMIHQPNALVYEVDSNSNECKWINTMANKRGENLIYKK